MKHDLIFGIHAVTARLSRATDPLVGAVLWVDKNRLDSRISTCITMAEDAGVTLRPVGKNKLNKMIWGNHQGLILAVHRLKRNSGGHNELIDFLGTLTQKPLLLVLDNVTDPNNLGACLRVADGAGVDAVIAPKDRSASLTSVAIKVASGAAESVPFYQVSNLARTLRYLADLGIWLIGTDDKTEDNIFSLDYNGAVAVILGNEGSGLRRLTKEICHQLVSIPMYGTVSSLNVSVAAGVILYSLLGKRI